MKKVLILFLLAVICSYPSFSQKDTLHISLANYKLFDGTYSYRAPAAVGSNYPGGIYGFYDKTTWNSLQYEEGHLRRNNTEFRQNYRYLKPVDYDPNYAAGYPLILVLHGAVERGNCWDKGSWDCYYGTTGSTGAKAKIDPPDVGELTNLKRNNLLNNDHQLLNGGQKHLAQVNLAGSKKPGDPTLHPKAFPGFVIFPQMWNGWNETDVNDAVRIVRLFIKKYNVDPDRIYVHGLSNGGRGVLRSIVSADWLFAAALPMSAVTDGINTNQTIRDYDEQALDTRNIPFWWFQGGLDANPLPVSTEALVDTLRRRGTVVRYTKYPNLGHGVWNTAYNEQDFFSWILSKNKSDLHVMYGMPRICQTNSAPATLMMPREFYAFQWEKEGQGLLAESGHILTVTTPGRYRGRFSRIENPGPTDWNQWSKYVEITVSAPERPVLSQNINGVNRSIHLNDLNQANNTSASTLLSGPTGYYYYDWYRNGSYQTFNSWRSSISGAITTPGSSTTSQDLTLVVRDVDRCPSPTSNPRVVWFNGRPSPANIVPKPKDFKGDLSGPVAVLLTWKDETNSERGYEIWRSTQANAGGAWTLIAITPEDAVLYNDINLQPGTTYYYKIRAVSNLGKSDYAPSPTKNSPLNTNNVVVTTLTDVGVPSVPQNVTAEVVDTEVSTKTVSILLKWDASTDDSGVKQYRINYGNKSTLTGTAVTSYTVSGVDFPINQNFAFTVQALDNSNNASAPSSQVNVSTYFKGLYWNHNTSFYSDLSRIDESQWNVREFTGKSDNLTLAPATQEAYVLIRFFGYLYVNTPGTYKIRTLSNDGTHIYFEGDTLIFHNGVVPIGECLVKNHWKDKVLTIPSAGPQAVEIRYWQSEDDMCLSWEWQGPDAGPDPEAWYPIPNIRLRSYDLLPKPVLPDEPENLSALATGLNEITLNWAFNGTPPVDYEVYRSNTANGTYSMIARVASTGFADNSLSPGLTYHYKVRTVNNDGQSAFLGPVNATTPIDIEDPSVPQNLVLYSNTLTSASVGWDPSVDNVAVTGYKVYLDGILYGTTSQNFIVLQGLIPQTDYGFTVLAYDASGKESGLSEQLLFSTKIPEFFYSKPTGNLNELSTWGKDPDGEGEEPINFSTNGYIFTVANRIPSTSVGGEWIVEGGVSRIIVPAGVSLVADDNLQGNVELSDNSSIVLSSNTQPTFLNLAITSTVSYDVGATSVQRANYGNLVLSGAGSKTFSPGTTTIRGNLLTTNNVAVNGAPDNATIIDLFGDYVVSGSPGVTASGSAVTLNLRKTGTQLLGYSGTLNLFELRATTSTIADMNNGGSPSVLSLGSASGGGLVLETGGTLRLENNTLRLVGAGAINSSGENGEIFATNATIDVTTSSDLHSEVYFNPAGKTVTNLNVNATGAGMFKTNNAVDITDGIKIYDGEINSEGNITMLSTPSKTANLHEIENSGRISGIVHVQRYYSLKNRMYRYISSPVAGTRVSDWQAYFPITGDFTGSNSNVGSDPSLFVISDAVATPSWLNYPDRDFASPFNDASAPIEKGRGYAAFVRKTIPFVMTNSGEPHQGSVAFSPLYAPKPSFDGWSLVGNPYASVIKWSNNSGEWTKNASVGNFVAIRNNTSQLAGQFVYYDATTTLGTGSNGLIAPGQAFYVQAIGPAPALTIHESAKFNDQQQFYRDRSPEEISHLYVNLVQGETKDQALVVFSSERADDYELSHDAMKLRNDGMFNFSTLTKNGTTVAINHMNNAFCEKTIRLSVQDIAEGEYTLEFPNAMSVHGIGSIKLVDHYLGQTTDLSESAEYTFVVNSDSASWGSERFEVTFNRPDLNTNVMALSSDNCADMNKIILSATQRGASYSILNSNGTEINAMQTSTGNDLEFIVAASELKDGVNNFMINAGFEGCGYEALSKGITIEYYHPANVVVNDVSTCEGASASVIVSSDSENIAGYNWYDASNTKIKGFSSNVMETPIISSETFFSVAPVLKNGCEGPRQGFVVYPETLDQPELVFESDTLFATAFAGLYEWSVNGEVIATTTENFITGLNAGSYQVACKTGGCAKTSKVFGVTESAGDIAVALQYQLFPNPTSAGNVNLKVVTTNTQDVLVKVIDVLGKEHYLQSFTPEQLRNTVKISPASEFRAGVYYMILKQESRYKEIKFVIAQ